MRLLLACAIAVVTVGCGKLFGIDPIPYEGSGAQDVGIAVDVPPNMFQLDVTTFGGAGTVMIDDGSGSPTTCAELSPVKCSGQYSVGTTVTLTATAEPTTSVFVIWEDGCLHQNINGTTATCTLSPTGGDVLVTARFAPSDEAWLALIPDDGSVDDSMSAIACSTCEPTQSCTAGGTCVSFLNGAAATTVSATTDPGCTAFGQFRSNNPACATSLQACSFTPPAPPSVTVIEYDFVTAGSNCAQ